RSSRSICTRPCSALHCSHHSPCSVLRRRAQHTTSRPDREPPRRTSRHLSHRNRHAARALPHPRRRAALTMPSRKPAVHPLHAAHRTDPSGLIPGTVIARGTTHEANDLTAYYGIAPSIIRALLDLWLQQLHPLAPIERTVFLDVGAGKGRAMLLASEHPFLR